MASSSNYVFDNLTNIRDDKCGLSQRNVQNMKVGSYLTTSFFNNDCTMQNPINLATSQPGVFYSGSSQMAIGGCNVDDNTKLLFKTTQPDLACRLDLNATSL